MAAIAYSVPSLPRRSHSGRPKPTEKRNTRTPLRRATQKWPNSWKVTSTPRLTIIHQTEPKKLLMRTTGGSGRRCSGRGDRARDVRAGLRVRGAQHVEGRRVAGRQRGECIVDQCG